MTAASKKISPITDKTASASVYQNMPAARKATAKPIARPRSVVGKKQMTAGSSVVAPAADKAGITSGDTYTVYRSPLEPVHLTREQIAWAVAKVRRD